MSVVRREEIKLSTRQKEKNKTVIHTTLPYSHRYRLCCYQQRKVVARARQGENRQANR